MPTFNQPERFLLEQWSDAQLVENAVKQIRIKYKSKLDQVLEELEKQYPNLNHSKRRVASYYGGVAIGKATWPKGGNNWPTGFYVEDLRLENLTSAQSGSPHKWVWIFCNEAHRVKSDLKKTAATLLGKEEAVRWEFWSDKSGGGIGCPIESREEILRLLMEDESQGFVDCIVAHFNTLVKFTSIVDAIVTTAKRGRK
ncbi:MAG: hypothetical protein K8T25_14400 [Planctomycetia bacterium]|nr:hypothetical protein [Planctomycetia bacterium]